MIRGDALRAGRVSELLRGAATVLRRRTVAARWSFSPGLEVETAVRAFRFRPRAAFKAASALRNWGPVRQNWTRMRRIIGD